MSSELDGASWPGKPAFRFWAQAGRLALAGSLLLSLAGGVRGAQARPENSPSLIL
ncbi:MAG TPA: hypothetical protein PKW33_19400 [Anaerolineaceae bacterium]|nr:hypothetical protein [Anaerolineaceae bacterium]HPN53770.1 hypothetical protein [Anaerolineaceae bacterium]